MTLQTAGSALAAGWRTFARLARTPAQLGRSVSASTVLCQGRCVRGSRGGRPGPAYSQGCSQAGRDGGARKDGADIGEPLLQALVWPRGVEVGGVLAQNAPHATEEPLAGGVLPGGTVGGPQHGDAARLGHARESRLVLAVVIADEVPGLLPEGRRLTQLLGQPDIGRSRCWPPSWPPASGWRWRRPWPRPAWRGACQLLFLAERALHQLPVLRACVCLRPVPTPSAPSSGRSTR
jgi:hypothetical protein